jgi:multidrug efflux system outer membrane protein
MQSISKTFTLIFCLFLTSCAMGPNFVPPEVETPIEYRRGLLNDKSLSDLEWWELFDDPLLQNMVSRTFTNNHDLLIAASQLEEARAFLGITKADQFPRIDIDAGASRGNFAGGSRSETINSAIYAAPVLRWEIDFWGKFRRATEAAQAQLLASEYGLRALQLSLAAEVVSTYYLLLDYHQRLNISRETLNSRLKSLDIIEQRFTQGILPEIDLNQAQIQKEIAAAAIPAYQRLIAKTEHALSILMGGLPEAVKTGHPLMDQSIPPRIPTGLPARLLERRPDIAQAMYALKAQTARIGVAEALRLPTISLTGLLGVASSELSTITSNGEVWSIGGSLLGPLFDFQKTKRQVDIEKERARQALLAYEKTVLTAFREVEDALVEVDTYQQQLEAVSEKLRAARNANELSKERYDKGVTSYLEVLEADRTLFSVEVEIAELKQYYLNAYVKLYKALGGGWTMAGSLEKIQ